MKSVSISGSSRANVGKRDSKDLRNAGQVPCVLYGGKEQFHFSAPYNDFSPLVYTPNVYTVNLTIDGKEYKALMQDIQFDPVNDKILHIDFLLLHEDKHVVIDLPVRIEGTSVGVRQGGKLLTPVRKLKVRALPKNLPDSIPVNVENLGIGQTVKVAEIQKEGVQFLDTPNMVVATVRMTRNVAAATAEAAKGAPAKTAAKK